MKLIHLLYIVSIPVLFSCTEIIEKDISKKQIRLFAPKDSASSRNYTITFWWEELEGASEYQLQVVQTDSFFKDSLSLETDTIVSANQFKTSLYPGHYLWSVTALNGAYSSARSQVYRLKVDSVSIAGQRINVTSPNSSTIWTNISTVKFTWQELFGAEAYEVSIDTSGKQIKDTTQINSYTLQLKTETEYSVFIQAISGIQKSIKSEAYVVVYDKTSPDTVKVKTDAPGSYSQSVPAETDTVSAAFSWDALYDKSGINYYTIRIQTSGNGKSIDKTSKTSGLPLSGLGLTRNTIYSWTITATDMAGNTSKLTKPRYFRIL